jgi:hypothetical protein
VVVGVDFWYKERVLVSAGHPRRCIEKATEVRKQIMAVLQSRGRLQNIIGAIAGVVEHAEDSLPAWRLACNHKDSLNRDTRLPIVQSTTLDGGLVALITWLVLRPLASLYPFC